jgi:tRNA(fMet)-specific endonuclease VapC
VGVILDTSLLVAFERGAVDLDPFIHGRTREPFGISVITASELLHGVHRADTAKRRIKRAAYVEKVLDEITVYSFDLAAARVYADVWARLQRQGVQIGAHDTMIASTALSLGFSVATLDVRDYGRIEGLAIEHVDGS